MEVLHHLEILALAQEAEKVLLGLMVVVVLRFAQMAEVVLFQVSLVQLMLVVVVAVL
jgi:hypothetical protein